MLNQQLTPEGQRQFGDLVDLFLVYGYDIGLECYKAGIKDMHSLFTAPDFLANKSDIAFIHLVFLMDAARELDELTKRGKKGMISFSLA